MAEFYVNQAAVPLGVGVFSCVCGARLVQYGLERPSGWSTAMDLSDRCQQCTSAEPLDGDRAAHAEEPDGSTPAR
jgi:hypothetical protein